MRISLIRLTAKQYKEKKLRLEAPRRHRFGLQLSVRQESSCRKVNYNGINYGFPEVNIGGDKNISGNYDKNETNLQRLPIYLLTDNR